MTGENRRRLAALVTGIAGTLVALLSATWLRQDACLDAGGRWVATARACELPAGAHAVSPLRAYAIGAAAGLVAIGILWRTFTFFTSRAARRPA